MYEEIDGYCFREFRLNSFVNFFIAFANAVQLKFSCISYIENVTDPFFFFYIYIKCYNNHNLSYFVGPHSCIDMDIQNDAML